jgi:hypothetical protein
MDLRHKLAVALQTVDELLRAIEQGECVALRRCEAEIRVLREKLVLAVSAPTFDAALTNESASLLNREHDFAREAKLAVARTAARFLSGEAAHYSRLRAERALTEEEKRFGREHFLPLIENLRALLGVRPSEPEKGGAKTLDEEGTQQEN